MGLNSHTWLFVCVCLCASSYLARYVCTFKCLCICCCAHILQSLVDLQKYKGAYVSVTLYMTFNTCFVIGVEAECVFNQAALLIKKGCSLVQVLERQWFRFSQSQSACSLWETVSPDKIVRSRPHEVKCVEVVFAVNGRDTNHIDSNHSLNLSKCCKCQKYFYVNLDISIWLLCTVQYIMNIANTIVSLPCVSIRLLPCSLRPSLFSVSLWLPQFSNA